MPHVLQWTQEEDDSLRALIQRYGEKKWAVVASELGTKSSKQCRRRWKNALSIDAKATEWTTEEDSMLVRLHRELGNKWTEISRRFGDRTDNAVKNRWHALCRKQPNLAQELSPLTTVGVRRGTRTRPASQSSSDDYSEGGPSKRRRRGTSSGAGTSAGPSHATHPQQGAAGPSRQARGAKGLPLPTPFDQRAAPPASVIYVNRSSLNPHELQLAQEVNSLGVPVHIEVAELGTFPTLPTLPTLPGLPALPPLPPGSSFPEVPAEYASAWRTSSNAAAAAQAERDTMAEIMNWLNSGSALSIPLSSGDLVLDGNGSGPKSGHAAAAAPPGPMATRRSSRSISSGNVGSGSRLGSGSSSDLQPQLSKEQRELICNLYQRVRSGVEQQPANVGLPTASNASLLPDDGEGMLPNLASFGPAFQRSTSLGFGKAGSFGASRSIPFNMPPRVDPLRRTRSSSNDSKGGAPGGGGIGGWSEAAAAAVEHVDSLPLEPLPWGLPPSGPLTRHQSSRDSRGAAALNLQPRPLQGPVADVSISPAFTEQELDLIISKLNLPTGDLKKP